MNAPTLEERMDNLEKIVEPLRELPDRVTRVEEQIVQLRTEMRGEFSAIRRDMATKEDLSNLATKDDIVKLATKDDIVNLATKDDIANLATKDDIANLATKEDLFKYATKDDIVTLATKDEMRMLHEDLVERLKVLGERWSRPKSTPRSKKPQ